MPDMQTEVKKIISTWTLPEEAPKVAKTPRESDKSFSEQIYDFIKTNPKCSMPHIRRAFNITNKDDASIASTLKTLYDRKLIGRVAIDNPEFKGYGRRVIFVYWAVATTYETQIKGLYSKKKKTVSIVTKKQTKGVAETNTPAPQDAPRPHTGKAKFNAEEFVSSLNIYDARHVYQLLDIVFGKQGK
jgi:hypothetical protein